MPTAINGYAGARTGSGLLITAAVHVALGAALLSLGVVKLGPPPKSITTINVPERPKPIEQPMPPVIEEPIKVPIFVPRIEFADDLPPPPPTTLVNVTTVEPPIVMPTAGGKDITAVEPKAAPMLVTARLDPRYAARFQPPYPPASERQEEEGVVMVRVRVGTDGRVLSAELKASSGHRRLDEAAVEHARRAWRFVPATRDGVAVESWREVPVRFELKNG